MNARVWIISTNHLSEVDYFWFDESDHIDKTDTGYIIAACDDNKSFSAALRKILSFARLGNYTHIEFNIYAPESKVLDVIL